MRHFFLTFFLILACIFFGHAAADALPSLSAEESADAAPPPQAKAPAAEPVAAAPAPPPTSASADAGEAAKGAESLSSLVSEDKKAKTEGDEKGEGEAAAADGSTTAATTASGAPSLAAEEQADVQTPAEKQAAQQTQDAQAKIKAAQAQKDKADAEKAAADAQLRAAESRSPIDPKEYAAAKAAEEKAKKDQADAEKAQKDADKAEKDAKKADAEAAQNGAKLRAANNDAKKADADLAKLKGPPPTGTDAEIAAAQKKSDEAHAKADKFREAGQTATSRADAAKADLAKADKEHDEAQADVLDKEKALAEAQSKNPPDEEAIKTATNNLKDAQKKETTTKKELAQARTKSQKANATLNAELMKTETPEQTRARLAAAANANLSGAQSAQEEAQTNVDDAQTALENAKASGAPPAQVDWLHRKLNVLQLKLSGATAEVDSATKAANAANADVGSPVGVAQNNVQQLQAQQQDLESQHQSAVSAAEAANQVIQSLPAGTSPTTEQLAAKKEADAKVAELQKKMESNTAAIGEAQAHLTVAQENEAGYQKALAEKRAAKKDQEKAAAEEVAAQKNLAKLKKDGASQEQIVAAEAKLMNASERNSKATALLAETETTFAAAEKRAMGPIQKLRINLEQSEKTIAELRIKKVRIDQELEEQKALLAQQEGKGDSNMKELEKNIARLQFESDNLDEKIKGLQKTINEDQTKIAAIDQAVSSSVLGEEGAPGARVLSRQIKNLDRAHADLSTGSVVVTPAEQLREEEMEALSPSALGRPVPDTVDPLAPDIGTEEGLRTQIPTFQGGGSQPIFGPGGGPVANFTSPGSNPNFNNVAGKVATFAGAGAVPTFASSAGDVSFGDSVAPLPWAASSAKVPTFGATQPPVFGGGGGTIPVFGGASQNAFGAVGGGGGSSSVAGGNAAALSPLLPGDGLTKIKTATHLAELAPPTVSAEKKQALLRAKEALTRATENLKAAERTENLRAISSAHISRDVATFKYEQALNNASPLGVPETEANGWWNKDPSSPYGGYNVDGGGRMNAPLQTSERTEHFILSDLQTLQPVRVEQLPDGARVLAVENVGFAMKAGKAIPTIVKLAKAAAAATI